MDTELARTFLTVVTSGNFVKAAERLYITQSAVSSRIQSLEQQLGCTLFVRNKAGAHMTEEGRLFQPYAVSLLRTVESAQKAVGVPAGYRASLKIGGRFALWKDILLPWLAVMASDSPDIAVHAELGFDEELTFGLTDGRLDIALMYTPQSHPGLTVEPLIADELVLVTDSRDATVSDALRNYTLVDWGRAFISQHAARFPDVQTPPVTTNIGWIALEFVLERGGSAYLPRRMALPWVAGDRLFVVPDAPVFQLPAYMVYPTTATDGPLQDGLCILRKLARQLESKTQLPADG